MSVQSANNKRILKNSIFLYIRMLLVMGVTLYTSRVVLEVLGVSDFGIYNVVGGLVVILGFFTSSLSNVAQRYINIGLGHKDEKATELAFRQSLTLMFILSLLVLLLGETIGLWFVYNKLNIPYDRLHAALYVYQFALFSTVCSINQVSLMAAIVAHERMNVYAYLGIFEATARLIIAVILIYVESVDHLIVYSGLTSLIFPITLVIYLVYCLRHFKECRILLYWNWSMVKEMICFVSYNVFGCFAFSASVQGTNILLNIFFGPAVNAARGISVQISHVLVRFTESITTAVKPQIIKSYVEGDCSYMYILIEKSSKYAFYLSAILAIPLIFETEYILKLWLGQVPEYSIAFTRLTLVDALIGIFVPPLWIATNATGNIKRNQLYGRLLTLSILPLTYVLLLFYVDPKIPFVLTIMVSILYWGYSLYDIHQQISLPIGSYLQKVLVPSAILAIVLIVIGYFIVNTFEESSMFRMVILFTLSIIFATITILMLLDASERNYIKKIIKKFI